MGEMNRFRELIEQRQAVPRSEPPVTPDHNPVSGPPKADKTRQELIDELQQERNVNQIGTHPSEVWGEDADRLCSDFLEYMQLIYDERSSGNTQQIVGAESARRDRRIGWMSMFRRPQESAKPSQLKPPRYYPIAFSDTFKIIQSWGTGGAKEVLTAENKYRKPHDKPAVPERDILLCADGLLRTRRGGALEVIDPTGRVRVPKVGNFVLRSVTRTERSFDNVAQDTWTETRKEFTKYSLSFKPVSLERALLTIAMTAK